MSATSAQEKVIAFAVYPGLRLLDLVSTYSNLVGLTMDRRLGYRLVTVGERREPTATDTPLQLMPAKTFAELPTPHALVVPGAGPRAERVLSNDGLLAYVRSAAEGAEWVAGTDTGALALAASGLLRGRQATTHWTQASTLERLGASYVRQPWVEDGKLITTAGVSGGGDMALHLLAKLRNKEAARLVQLLAEYDPEPPFGRIDWTLVSGADPAITAATPAAAGERTIAFVIYPGLTPLDLVGPLQVLTELSRFSPQFRPVVVAEQKGPLAGDNGLTLVADTTFDEAPHPAMVVVPGGGEPTLQVMSNPTLRKYVASAAQTAEIVASVCTGALILASLGLLKGKPATTHWAYASILKQLGSPYRRARWVEDGRLIMSAGVSAGVDMALYLAARLTDEATARRLQLALQYDPQPPFGRIDWRRMPLLARFLRATLSLRAPFIAAGPKRLLAAGR
jgi:transcriptional regulator GlxA family with amidase domain